MSRIEIAGRAIGDGQPVFVVAEMSANHDRDLDQALELVELAAAAGVDAIKLQTYSADSLSLRTSHPSARVDPVWGAETLYDLYQKAAMPFEFHEPIFARARELGLIAFSTPFDEDGVEFLESFDVPAYKIASPEIVHLPLLQSVGQTGKPVILSTGMSKIGEVEEALEALTGAGANQIVLLHCCSVYPADPAMINLSGMETLRQAFGRPVGFSDHTLGVAIPIAATALGACLVEKHFTNDPRRAGPDHRFSISGDDLARMVDGIRQASLARGSGGSLLSEEELQNRNVARRSLFAYVDIPAGTMITEQMIRIVRPASGLHPRFRDLVIGRVAIRDIAAGWPITWKDV